MSTCTLKLSNLDAEHALLSMRIGLHPTFSSDFGCSLEDKINKASTNKKGCEVSLSDTSIIYNLIIEYRKENGWPSHLW